MTEGQIRLCLARNVRRLRKACALTQKSLATRAGMHWRHVQKIEKSEVNVTLHSLARLARALGVNASDLLVARKT
jgi:transcriptional regulator with XRE-family HTH domain